MLTVESMEIKDVTSYIKDFDSVPLPIGELPQKILNSVYIDPRTRDIQFYTRVLGHLTKGRIDLIYLMDGAEYISLMHEYPTHPFLNVLLQSDHWNWADLTGVITSEEKRWIEQTLPIMRIVTWAEKHYVPIHYL